MGPAAESQSYNVKPEWLVGVREVGHIEGRKEGGWGSTRKITARE